MTRIPCYFVDFVCLRSEPVLKDKCSHLILQILCFIVNFLKIIILFQNMSDAQKTANSSARQGILVKNPRISQYKERGVPLEISEL